MSSKKIHVLESATKQVLFKMVKQASDNPVTDFQALQQQLYAVLKASCAMKDSHVQALTNSAIEVVSGA